MSRIIGDFLVKKKRQLKNQFFVLELVSAVELPEILPGQFTQVRVDGSPETFLRRPFSFYDVDRKNNSISLLVQVVGKGTQTLSRLREGASVNMVLPLGNSFTIPSPGEKVIFIGGGVGIAPFLHFARHISGSESEADILFGFRNRDRVIEYEEFRQYGSVHITTEDGSEGEKGFVTGHSILQNKSFDRIYCCGPDPMMKAVAAYAAEKRIFCEVSLENLMGCGFGVCLCCIVATTRGNICTCTEGPVFNVNELKW
jgi:dihydroorotate dehydrogenase electron transfer subunit